MQAGEKKKKNQNCLYPLVEKPPYTDPDGQR